MESKSPGPQCECLNYLHNTIKKYIYIYIFFFQYLDNCPFQWTKRIGGSTFFMPLMRWLMGALLSNSNPTRGCISKYTDKNLLISKYIFIMK